MVVGPPHEVATVRSVQLVSLAPRLVLAVLVLSNGAIEKHTVELDQDVDELVVNAAGVRLAGTVARPDARRRWPSSSTDDIGGQGAETDVVAASCGATLDGPAAASTATTTRCSSAAPPTWPPPSTPWAR